MRFMHGFFEALRTRIDDRDERGASAVFVALVVVAVIIPLGAMAVDLGVQRVAAQDVQAVADAAALDFARRLDGRPAKDYPIASWQGEAAARAGATGAVGREAKFVVELGTVDPTKFGTEQHFKKSAGGEVPTAVRVIASTDAAFTLAAGLRDGAVTQGSATRSAIAAQDKATVCFSAGTQMVGFDSNNIPILGPLAKSIFGASFKNSFLSSAGVYNQLFELDNVLLPVGGLVSGLGVMLPEQLAQTELSVGDVLVYAADTLQQSGDVVNASLFNELLGVVVNGDRKFILGDLLKVEAGTDLAGLALDVNLLDFLGISLMLANGTSALSFNDSAGMGFYEFKIIEKPQIACGGAGTSVKQAQFDITYRPVGKAVEGMLNGAFNLLDIFGTGAKGVETSFRITAGGGEVKVAADPVCGNPHQVRMAANVYGVGLEAKSRFQIPLLIVTAGYEISAATYMGVAKQENRVVNFPAFNPDWSEQEQAANLPTFMIPSGAISQTITWPPATVKTTPTGLVGAIFAPILNLAGMLVTGITSAVFTPLINVAMALTGIKASQAEVKMLSWPKCGGTKLVG